MSKHIFTVEAEFDSGEEYQQFVQSIGHLGGEITDEESDYSA